MPFTFSHPAIVLPFNSIAKKYVSLTALIVGSITPDFEYFLRMKIQSIYSHTVWGNIWFNIPLGLIICFLFHNIIKKPFIDNSPLFVQQRLIFLRNSDWNNYAKKHFLVVVLSLIIGGYSHILWDSFTHATGIFVHYLGLNQYIFYHIAFYKILQHFSSFIGGIIIFIYFFKLEKITRNTIKPRLCYWIMIFLGASIIFSIRCYLGLRIGEYGNIIVIIIASSLWAITIVSLFLTLKGSKW